MTRVALTAPVQSGAIPMAFTPPAPIDKAALKLQLQRLQDPELLELQKALAAAYDAACLALIGPNDVQVEGKRTFKKKSAWRKLGRHFTISTQILGEELRQLEGGEFLAIVTVRGIASWGQVVEALGACGSDEEEGRRVITMADAIGTAQTRATNRAISDLIAMGEVSAEELADRPPLEEGRGRANGKAKVASEPELTLEEALALEFPWRKHKKYGGKLLADVSTRTLLVVGKWAHDKIKAEEGSRAIEKLYRATVLITTSRPDLQAVVDAMADEAAADDANTAAATAVDGEGAPVQAAPKDPRQLDALEQQPGPGERVVDGTVVDASGAPTRDADMSGASDRQDDEELDVDALEEDSSERDVATDAAPLVDHAAAPAPPKSGYELGLQLAELIDQLPPADQARFLERLTGGEFKTEAQIRRAIGQASLIIATA